MGKVIATMGEGEGIVQHECDINLINETRFSIPLGMQRRFDLYPDVSK